MLARNMQSVACKGCRKVLGYSFSSSWPGWCTEFCARDYEVSDNESRDDLIALLVRIGHSGPRIAEEFDMTHQRVYQIAARRNFEGGGLD